jgi:type I site-specific restriction-modification system R (restriction) subunit
MAMVWLTKWIRENVNDARVLIVTDREELDEQIHERVFKPAGEEIYRTQSGADLIATLNATKPWLICSLIHKFGSRSSGGDAETEDFIKQMGREWVGLVWAGQRSTAARRTVGNSSKWPPETLYGRRRCSSSGRWWRR